MIEVSAGLVFHQGKLLITQRFAQDHLGGLWEFPGGKRHEGESFEACLQRELQEELAIEVQVLEQLAIIDHVYPERSVHLRFFRCLLTRGVAQAIGCQNLAWISAAELSHYAFPAADARLLEQLAGHPEYWSL